MPSPLSSIRQVLVTVYLALSLALLLCAHSVVHDASEMPAGFMHDSTLVIGRAAVWVAEPTGLTWPRDRIDAALGNEPQPATAPLLLASADDTSGATTAPATEPARVLRRVVMVSSRQVVSTGQAPTARATSLARHPTRQDVVKNASRAAASTPTHAAPPGRGSVAVARNPLSSGLSDCAGPAHPCDPSGGSQSPSRATGLVPAPLRRAHSAGTPPDAPDSAGVYATTRALNATRTYGATRTARAAHAPRVTATRTATSTPEPIHTRKATRTPTATATPPGPPLPRITADRPLRLLVTGDSLSEYFGPDLVDLAGSNGMVRGSVDIHYGTGLVRPDFVDWSLVAKQQAENYHPDAVVVLLGGNDAQNMVLANGQIVYQGTKQWLQEYRRRARICMRTWLEGGVRRVYWLAMPPARSSSMAATDLQIDLALRQAAAGIPGAEYVDILPLVTDHGAYADALQVGGQWMYVREADGIHLSRGGAQRVAATVLAIVRKEWHLKPS